MCDLCNCFGSRWCDFVSSCEEAPAAAEHYFWCMLGMPGVERGLQPLGPVPFPLPQSKARPQPSRKQRTTPTPSRQSPSRPRMRPLARKRRRSPGTEMLVPEKVSPERPATEMLLEKIRGSMQGLLERNWVEEFSHHFPSREKLDAKMIEAWSAVVPMCVFFWLDFGGLYFQLIPWCKNSVMIAY